MKFLLALVLVTAALSVRSQNIIHWDGIYELNVSDFQATGSQIGSGDIYSFSAGSSFSFAFHMTNGEFMFTKNFNSKVDCTFDRSLSVLIAPDSAIANNIVAFARYEFDLCELYARKLRQRLYDEKGAFSDVSFFRPIYDQTQREYAERRTTAATATELGANKEKLNSLRGEVKSETEALADFCKTCKPPKRKK